ncbi:MAG: hypothetical protein WCW93_02915 [Candidatus Paceibacterota bacterium]
MKEAQSKNCINCKQDFTIEPEDFNFYEKIKVPPPTFCPECRLQRRLSWMVNLNLFKRKCDLCGENVICKYEPTAPFVVFCHNCWWSDKWDSANYTKEIDFSKPFLLQFRELFHETPILGLSIDVITGKLSPYVNHCDNTKNSYLIFYSARNEDSMYGFYLVSNKAVLNSSMIFNSELCFDGKNNFKNYNAIRCIDTNESIDCAFLKDCVNCNHCFASINLRNKSYVFFNQQLTKEEYFKKISEIDLGSFKKYQEIKRKASEHFIKYPWRAVYENLTQNCTGSYLFESKNCKECYEVGYSKDCKYCMLMKQASVKDCYDYTDWGFGAEMIYDSIVVGENVSNVKFCWYVYSNSSEMEYSALCVGCRNCFGCVGLRNKQYCILNKQYPKEEYLTLREKIIKHMKEMSYIDSQGLVYKYGEFFPMEFSSYPYNNSFANFFFPKTKKEATEIGLQWQESNNKKHPITISFADLPDSIKDTNDRITKEIIGCSTCEKGYKITKQELDLSKKMNVPLSRQCPFCRIGEKVNKWVSQMRQISRICYKCGVNFKTHYKKEEAEKVLCKECYLQEVY